MYSRTQAYDIRLPRPEFAPDISTPPRKKTRLEKYGAFLVAIVVILLSQALEAFTARQIGPSLMGKMTLLFTGVVVVIAILPAFVMRTRTLLYTAWVNLPFHTYSLIALASVTWSTQSDETLKTAIVLICFHGTGVALAALFSWRNIWRGIAMGLLTLSVLSVLIIPHDGLMTAVHPGALRGLWLEKNASAESFAICAIACAVVALAEENWKWLLGTAFALGLILMARAAGALAASSLALSFLFFVEFIRRGPVRFFLGSGISIFIVAAIAFVIAGLGLEAAGLLGRDTSLTGRTVIWPTVIDFIKQKPWLGYGFQAFWVDGSDTKELVMMRAQFEAHNAHNSYLEMMLGIGAVGSFFIWFGVLRAMFQSSTALFGGNDARRFALGFFIFALVISLSESSLGDSAGMAAFVMGIMVPKVALSYAMAQGHFKQGR